MVRSKLFTFNQLCFPTIGHGTRVTIGCTKVAERCVLTMERSLRRLGDPCRYLLKLIMTVDDIAEKLTNSCITRSRSLMGCSDAEISSLESKYDVTLPQSYRRFLQLMGHHAAGLGEHPAGLLYPGVLLHTQRVREHIDRCNNRLRADYEFHQSVRPVKSFLHRVGIYREPETPTLDICDFPIDALVIYMENGLPEYWAIRCNNLDDSPVYEFDREGDLVQLRHRHDSLVNFLSSMLQQRLTAAESR